MNAKTGASVHLRGDWLQNTRWLDSSMGAAGLVHGTLTLPALPDPRPLPLKEAVERSIDRFGDLLRLEARSDSTAARRSMTIVTGRQVHSDGLAVVSDPADLGSALRLCEPGLPIDSVYEFQGTDALVTTRPGYLLLIKTADCLPILLCDPVRRIVGAAHCGWRGLYARLAGKTVEAMVKLGARPEALRAWIGPGVRASHYEVGRDMIDKFRRACPGTPVTTDGANLDLPRIALDQLTAAGLALENIDDSGECTFADAGLYHSYRRDGDAAGRMLNVIGLR